MDTTPDTKSVEPEQEIDERPVGTCECCPAENVRLNKYNKMNMCDTCADANRRIDNPTEEEKAAAEVRVQEHRASWQNNMNVHLEHVKQENAALRMSADIFNAKIKTINELKLAIDADPAIENKNFALAQVLNERYQHLNDILHGLRPQVADAENEQRAIQSYYNDFSKQLRQEEREKIRLSDISYKPAEVKVKAPKVVKPKKWDKTSVAVAAQKSGFAEQLIQMTCLVRDITAEAAVMILEESGVKKVK